MSTAPALEYWDSALNARHSVYGGDYAALQEERRALSIIAQRNNARLNELSPTARLPAELLQHSFRLLRESIECRAEFKETHEPPAWNVVTKICQRWRLIALDDPLLWRDIRLLPYRPWIAYMIYLSKSSPLIIRARLGHGYPASWFQKIRVEFNQLLYSSDIRPRISHLDISAAYGDEATEALKTHPSLPLLHRLFIRLDDSSNTERREFPWSHIVGKAPSLQCLMLAGFTFNSELLTTPYTSITRLSLRGGLDYRQSQMKTATFLRLLECLPTLEELLLENMAPLREDTHTDALPDSISIKRIMFRHYDLHATLPFISILSSIAIQLSLHTTRADKTTLLTLLSQNPLWTQSDFLSTSFNAYEEVLHVYVRYPPMTTAFMGLGHRRWPQELLLHLASNGRHADGHQTRPRVMFDYKNETGEWPFTVLKECRAHLEGSRAFTICVDDFMWNTSWRKKHWARLASLPARHIEAFNGEALSLFSVLCENPSAFPFLEEISVFDEDSSGQIWNEEETRDRRNLVLSRQPPYSAAEQVLRCVGLRREHGARPFKRIMLPKRYLNDAWLVELREVVEVVGESQHGDNCHCHKVHDPHLDFPDRYFGGRG
ncbi:hypothetical protein PENSPDRAFT_176306 [Peniophora sp. CONT]|nr:hypothetical protein PENSPDRAFT_176306 [Peniophora sp. CONT]